mmetsp:Transcript_31283/g.66573  ORF Transcript_31283/g.66573 Transcript_31283/m.66573 type:complete len:232 (-) Transcript_31283:1039-1734(-)
MWYLYLACCVMFTCSPMAAMPSLDRCKYSSFSPAGTLIPFTLTLANLMFTHGNVASPVFAACSLASNSASDVSSTPLQRGSSLSSPISHSVLMAHRLSSSGVPPLGNDFCLGSMSSLYEGALKFGNMVCRNTKSVPLHIICGINLSQYPSPTRPSSSPKTIPSFMLEVLKSTLGLRSWHTPFRPSVACHSSKHGMCGRTACGMTIMLGKYSGSTKVDPNWSIGPNSALPQA